MTKKHRMRLTEKISKVLSGELTHFNLGVTTFYRNDDLDALRYSSPHWVYEHDIGKWQVHEIRRSASVEASWDKNALNVEHLAKLIYRNRQWYKHGHTHNFKKPEVCYG